MNTRATQKSLEITYQLTIDMSADEARVLAGIMACVGGSSRGPRGVADNIREALENQGIDYRERMTPTGSLVFMDTWEETRVAHQKRDKR